MEGLKQLAAVGKISNPLQQAGCKFMGSEQFYFMFRIENAFMNKIHSNSVLNYSRFLSDLGLILKLRFKILKKW